MNSFFFGHRAETACILSRTFLFFNLKTTTSCLRIVYSKTPSIQEPSRRPALPSRCTCSVLPVSKESMKDALTTFIYEIVISGMTSMPHMFLNFSLNSSLSIYSRAFVKCSSVISSGLPRSPNTPGLTIMQVIRIIFYPSLLRSSFPSASSILTSSADMSAKTMLTK